jgi:hypothetical protein
MRVGVSGGYSLVCATLLLAFLSACGEEDPTEVGGTLLPAEAVRTFEVVIEPAAFFVSDTAFSGYAQPSAAGYFILANNYENTLRARGLVRFTIPTTISVRDSAGTTVTDTLPSFFGGRLLVIVDSLRSSASPVTVEAFRATQTWIPGGATWQLRVDTSGIRLPWAQPGGSPGAPIDTATWVAGRDTAAGVDTVVVRVDSATIAAWRDTANNVPGTVVGLRTVGARLRVTGIALAIDAHSSIDRDTVVTVTAGQTAQTFIFDPPVAEVSAEPRMGGLPSWRTFITFKDRLDTLTVPCPGGPAGCRIQLDDAAVTYAALLLKPTPPPPGFAPEDSVQLGARLLLVDPLIPLKRSPLGEVAGVMPRGAPASVFRSPNPPDIELPITNFISLMTRDSASATNKPDPVLALLPALETATFGFAQFATPPRLKLVLTVATQLQLR